MKVEIFTFCDYAAEYGDKLCIIGICEVFFARRFPISIPSHFLAYKLRLGQNHAGSIHLTFRIDDDAGENLKLITLDVEEPPKLPGFGYEPIIGAVWLDFLTLPRAGGHSASLLYGGKTVASIPILAVQSSGMG
ncbi:MAG: hypothetical protein WDM80_19195 [Limisphaerales bacterium]